MADGRKNNGGARQGAGRKPKDEEQKEIELIDSALEPDKWVKLFKSLYTKAVADGDTSAAKLIIERRYGKAKETVNLNHTLQEGVKLPDWMNESES